MIYGLPHKDLILASSSETRVSMLTGAGLKFSAKAANIDESSIKESAHAQGLSSLDTATLLAEIKAKKISLNQKNIFVLGSDQLLDCEGRWFSKPKTRNQAFENLKFLSGKSHRLFTAAVICENGQRLWQHTESSTITLRSLDDGEIDTYLDMMGDAAFFSPGSYMIEGLGAQIISRIDGCFYSVLGLPLLQLLAFLRDHGLQRLESLE